MAKLSEALYFAAITLWVGGLWSIGYIVAPVLFFSLADRQLAGILAGKMFTIIGWIGIGCSAYLLIFIFSRWGRGFLKSSVFWLVLMMLLITMASQFGLQPLLAKLKEDALPREVMESLLRNRFAVWHGVSSILYMMQSMLGLWLVVWGTRGMK